MRLEKRSEEPAVVRQLEMEELVDDYLASEFLGLMKKSCVKTHATQRRAAGPLVLHAYKMDCGRFHLQAPGPRKHFGLEHLSFNRIGDTVSGGQHATADILSHRFTRRSD
jgi:hypothetical protein